MHDFEISELLVIGEFEIPDTPHSLQDGFIEHNNPAVDTGVCDGEEVDNIFPITGEFLHPVGESKDCDSDYPVPGNSPITSIFDKLRVFNCSEGDFKVSEFFNFGVIMCG